VQDGGHAGEGEGANENRCVEKGVSLVSGDSGDAFLVFRSKDSFDWSSALPSGKTRKETYE
jgi:hypothetical protein